MALVFSAIAPHPPLLIPAIGKDNLVRVQKTVEAMKQLEQELYAAKPDTILIISPHGLILPDAFVINFNPFYESHLEEFGDFTTKLNFKPDTLLVNNLKESLANKFPLVVTSEPHLDHGAVVPLYYLTAHLPNFTILPLGYSFLPLKTHYEFGKAIQEEIVATNKRVAVVASGDLSHRLTPDAPAGHSPRGKEFDEKIIELIANKNVVSILNLDPKFIEEAGECGLRSLVILLGILDKMNYSPQLFSYEGPFGVGYLVCNFRLA